MDIGDRNSNYCLVAASGEVLSENRVATKLDSLATLFLSMDTCRVVLEACGHVHWIAQLAAEAGHASCRRKPTRSAADLAGRR